MIARTSKYGGPERRRRPRWRPRPVRVLLVLLALAASGYSLAVVWLIREESSLVSQASTTLGAARPPFRYDHVDLPRTDGARQFAWVMRSGGSDAGPWVVYLHGSATTIASPANISRYRLLRRAGVNVLAPEYRGFGGLDGTPSEASLQADARAAYDYLRNTRNIAPPRIGVYGWSLGSAVAVALATEVQPAAVILEGAPASVVDITQQRYPFFPIRLLMRRTFESIGAIGRVSSPILFVHGTDDEMVPMANARRLFEAARSEKTFVEVRGRHFDASEVDAEQMSAAIRLFLERHRVS